MGVEQDRRRKARPLDDAEEVTFRDDGGVEERHRLPALVFDLIVDETGDEVRRQPDPMAEPQDQAVMVGALQGRDAAKPDEGQDQPDSQWQRGEAPSATRQKPHILT
ncbi:hypothetical protein FHR83_007200 [Actinoplanes campanulatus]|uniref:Uncharacterized protein n=1 Tax=Actinoplanes campanulatus TaxID=113559 RepID=A0A7W5ANI7_9ACTN|nr:hypothetical protein [Actinoplanes campanulatus]MBB3099493.1 hypothetical protein [Actinoplanes campanulatus]GGN42571.1 hypothetical protein GCM10010109_73860 [Actinoplanes campanulatus]GID39842.1 hypothetical protein Aca09nite_63480 [Actinoplanes campanulatus]